MRAHYKFWPRRLPKSITLPSTSLWDNLATNARRYPDKAALVFFGTTVSYRQLMEGAERLAARLAQLGVQRGDRVVLCMQNCPQLVMAHFAILRANAVVVPVNPMNRAEELKHYITDPDTKVAITTGDLAPEMAKANNALAPGERLAHLVVTQFSDAFDVAVTGNGFIAVQNPNGGESYVRTGSLNVDALGVLRAGNGMPVMGNGGPIAVPPQRGMARA